jgi:predicted kinase
VAAGVVLVSGAPGAGKTSVAVPLAAALGFPLLAKDDLKEALYDALAPFSTWDLTESRRLSRAAMEPMWTIARRCPEVVLEANFRPRSTQERERLMALDGVRVEIHCRCGLALAGRRYAARADLRHPAHVLRELSSAQLSEFDAPIALGAVIELDTTRPVDVEALAAEVRDHLGRTRA